MLWQKRAPFANFSGKNPTDRGKRGIKYPLLVDKKAHRYL